MTNEARMAEWVNSISAAANAPMLQAVADMDFAKWGAVLATLPAALAKEAEQGLGLDLTEAVVMYAIARAVEPDLLGGTDHRSELKKLQKETTRLLGHINGLPRGLRLGLAMGHSRGAIPGVDLDGLSALLSTLRERVGSHIEKGLGKPQPGLKRPGSRARYMTAVVECWERYTGQRAGYSFVDGLKGVEYIGPFLDFADAVVGMANVSGAFKRRDFVEQIKAIRAGAEKPSK